MKSYCVARLTAAAPRPSQIGRNFALRERRSKLSVELRAGTITFLMVAYILAVNPQILFVTGGTCNSKELCPPEVSR